MTTALTELIDGKAFSPTRRFEQLSRFHVQFESLGTDIAVESALRRVLEHGGRAAIIGEPGTGKSSVISWLLNPPEELGVHYAPIRLGIGGLSDRETLGDSRQLAGRIIGDLAATYLERDDALAIRELGAAVVRVDGPSQSFRAQLGGKLASMSREVRQAAESFDYERTEGEVLAVLRDAIEAFTEGANFVPVLLLEDADGLLNLPRVAPDERPQIAHEFFQTGLAPLLRELEIPALVAAQERYGDLDGFRALERDLLEDVVSLPAPSRFSEGGVRSVVAHVIGEAGSTRPPDAVFEAEAMSTLVALRYAMPTMRSLMNVCDSALLEADAAGRDSISEPDIGYAATQHLPAA